MFRVLFVLAVIAIIWMDAVNSHSESGEWVCKSNPENLIQAEFSPGVVTLDGHADDWGDIDGFEFSLLPALDPHIEHEYKGGKMTVKALHDGRDVFFLLQVGGDYTYSKGVNTKCPSVALMFKTGKRASYHNMGGCKEAKDSCNSNTCRDYEVDIMHFSIGNAIPGRLYGGNQVDVGNGGDRFGHLVDAYSWNPHCLYLDGLGPSGNDSRAQNDWKGAWWHSSLAPHYGFVEEDSPYNSAPAKGTFNFEFSRPLRTMDSFGQDVQFKIMESAKFSAAFWYPVDGKAWHGSEHYSIGCDWVPLQILTHHAATTSTGSWDSATLISLLFSVAALCVSLFVAHTFYSARISYGSFARTSTSMDEM